MSTKDVAPQPNTLNATAYAQWLGQVAFLLRSRFGLPLQDVDYDWRRAFDFGQTPVTAAAMGVMSR